MAVATDGGQCEEGDKQIRVRVCNGAGEWVEEWIDHDNLPADALQRAAKPCGGCKGDAPKGCQDLVGDAAFTVLIEAAFTAGYKIGLAARK